MKRCPHCRRALDVIAPAELLRIGASMAPPPDVPIPEQVIEAAFLLTCMIDIEITRLAASPEQRERMLALVLEHVEERIAGA